MTTGGPQEPAASHDRRLVELPRLQPALRVEDVAADALQLMVVRDRSYVAQEAVRIGEEVQVRIEGEAILALLRHHDDEPAARHASKLRQRLTELEYVLQHVRADNRVERPVRERKLLDIRLLETDVGMARARAFLDDEIDAGQRQIGTSALEMVEQEARAAADIEQRLAVN